MESLKKEDSSQYKVDINITLTDLEKKIFKTLMDVVEENKLETTLRVAGGWVRDKVTFKRKCSFKIDYGKRKQRYRHSSR